MLFYPPERDSFHFRTHLPIKFKDSIWSQLNYEENADGVASVKDLGKDLDQSDLQASA